MPPTLRAPTPADAPTLGRIAYEAFKAIAERHAFPPDFPGPDVATHLIGSLVASPATHGVVAEADGRVVGSNFIHVGGPIAGVGPITVEPTAQNAGVGRRLMQAVVDWAATQPVVGVRLVQAGYHMRSLSLYASLGFDVREPLVCVQGTPLRRALPDRAVRAATPADADACNALCEAVHGHHRAGEVREAIRHGTATVGEHDGRGTGYATSVAFFGHAVGETTDDVAALIAAAPTFPGPGFLLPSRNTELLRWCLAHGLRSIQPMTLMSRGWYQEPRGAFLPSITF